MAVRNPINRFEYRTALPATSLPSYVNNRTVTAAESETVPSWAKHLVLSTDADLWYNPNGTAVVPSGDVTDGTGSLFLKAGQERLFDINGGETLSVISASGTAHVAYAYFP